jgi:glycosyltransferase involved in cell wall biosynthesis
MAKLSVVIPSRLATYRNGAAAEPFVARAIRSIREQKLDAGIQVEILVGIDTGAQVPAGLAGVGVRFVETGARSQAAALNAAARGLTGDYLAFLEDDDEWHPQLMAIALGALQQADFVSSTQLQVDEKGVVIKIMDFPTPSGWVMKRSVWQTIGEFDESFRWHLDNEWLGRLGDSRLPRIHLVEATAPINVQEMALARQELAKLVRYGGGNIRFLRHASPWPLVRRLVHSGSGLGQIAADPAKKHQSDEEYARLNQRFGRIPW